MTLWRGGHPALKLRVATEGLPHELIAVDRKHKRPFLTFGKYPALPNSTFLKPNSSFSGFAFASEAAFSQFFLKI
ncbi:MAG: hypothetical protein WCK49_10990, partial [Myxococcaceae bacterium]